MRRCTKESNNHFHHTVFTLQATTDRFNVNVSLSKNWDHLQNKFVGTGHPDITRQ